MNSSTFSFLEKIRIHDTNQWILIRGNNLSKPVLLYLQAGPGLPLISEARTMETLHRLEQEFVVVYWDQRACGKSYSKHILKESITLQQMVNDTLACTRYLLQRLQKKKIVLTGFSIGGTIALLAASQHPEYFHSVVTVGADLVIEEANRSAFAFAMEHAIAAKNKTAIQELNTLADQPILEPQKFQLRAKWLMNFGGINRTTTYNKLVLQTIKNMFLSKEYSFMDILKTMQGIEFSQRYLLPQLASLNLFEDIQHLNLPVYFLQGKHDPVAPLSLAQKFFDHISISADKELIIFEHSTHMPHYEEPEYYRNALLQVLKKK